MTPLPTIVWLYRCGSCDICYTRLTEVMHYMYTTNVRLAYNICIQLTTVQLLTCVRVWVSTDINSRLPMTACVRLLCNILLRNIWRTNVAQHSVILVQRSHTKDSSVINNITTISWITRMRLEYNFLTIGVQHSYDFRTAIVRLSYVHYSYNCRTTFVRLSYNICTIVVWHSYECRTKFVRLSWNIPTIVVQYS